MGLELDSQTVQLYPFLAAIAPHLPDDLAQALQSIRRGSLSADKTLDHLIQFISGGSFPANLSADSNPQRWVALQASARASIEILLPAASSTLGKRGGDVLENEADSKKSKSDTSRPGVSSAQSPPEDDAIRFKLHSISVTSPVRKKVDAVVCSSTIRFVNPSNQTVEAFIPLSSLTRAFLLPTRGKTKPHWTVVIISADAPDRGTSKAAKASSSSNQQVIFGLDATATAPLITTDCSISTSPPKVTTIKKGEETLPALQAFLATLPSSIIVSSLADPSTYVFTSQTASGSPGVEGYLGAKQGTLWFFDCGLLWGEAKPCEFWAVEDLLKASKGEALRMISATGRMFGLYLTRKAPVSDENEELEEATGDETQIGMIDAKEQDGIRQWVKQRRNAFGVDPSEVKETKGKAQEGTQGKIREVASGPMTMKQMGDLPSDDSDDDFAASSDSEDGSNGSDDESGHEGADDEDNEDGSGGDGESDADASGDEDSEETELDPRRHPLLRPGAMPKMSRAAIDAVVGMVEEDMLGGDQEMAEVDELDE
jgi:hypothetical protein